MTREEQIITACKGFLAAYPNIDQAGLSIGFLDGAVWSDKNPVNVWHDASEEPEGNSAILVQWNIKGNSGYEFYYADSINWDRYVEIYGVSIWAYISDLLPKGGEK